MNYFNQFINDLLTEVSYRTKEGIVDLKKSEHLTILSEVLDEMGLWEIKGELFSKLFEAEEKFYAVSKDSGKVVDFDSEENRDAAIKAGTHEKAKDADKTSDNKSGKVDSNDFTHDPTGKQNNTNIEAKSDILTSFANEKDNILKGDVSPPGTGGSAIGEMYGGTAIQDFDLTEDEFIKKHFEDVKNSEISVGMDDDNIKSWLKVAYKTGQSEINELKTNSKYRYKQPQSQPYPVPVMDPVNEAGNARKKLINLFEIKLKEAEEAGDKKEITHYKRQLFFIKKRKDTDTGVLYETTNGFIGFKHTSNKKGFNDPVFNSTVNQRGEVMKSSVEGVSNDYNFNEDESNKIESNIDKTVQTAVISIQEAGKGPSGALESNVSDTRELSSKHKLGNQFKNFGAGQKGRSNYLEDEIKAEMATNTKTGKKVNKILQEWGLEQPYSDDDIAAAVLELSKRGDTTGRVTTMVVKLSDNIKLARDVYNRLRKQNPNLSDDEIKEKVLETINGYKNNNGIPFNRESLNSLLSPDLDWLEKVGAQTRDAMGAAHEQIVTDLTNADEDWQRQNSPNEPQPPVNGPHTQSYIQSYMKQMHWDRYILGDEDDIGDMNIAGKTVNSTMIRGCLAELSGYSGNLDSKEDRDGLMSHLRKTMRISSESQSLTFNNVKSGKTIEIGKESYRTKGVGNNSLLGNFGKDLQSCLKSK